MSQTVGIDAVVYRNTGTEEAPAWAAVAKVADCTLNAAWDKVDASSRQSKAKRYAKTQIDVSASIRIKTAWSDPGYLALIGAATSAAGSLDLLILDGPLTTAGSRGFRGQWHIFSKNQDQSLGARLYDQLEAAPADSDADFSLAVVGEGSAVTFTAL